jgi:hypothetical protein
MTTWRREAVLDFYNLALAALLFASPSLFKLTNCPARLEFWVGGAAIRQLKTTDKARCTERGDDRTIASSEYKRSC